MKTVDRRSALKIGLAAAAAAIMKPAASQTTGYKETTRFPGVVERAYGENPSIIPGFKTVSIRDIIIQPGSKTANPPMMNAMVCHITEGELRFEQDGKRSEEHTSELQSPYDLVCRLLLEKKKHKKNK